MRQHRLAMLGMLGAGLALAASPALATGPSEPAQTRPNRRLTGARANVGRNHPDYGLSVPQHAANKRQRGGGEY